MSKNFDQERLQAIEEMGDRTFELGGETFTRRATIRPETANQYAALLQDFLEDLPAAETLKRTDETILILIETEGHERWRALREREDDAIDNRTIAKVLNWLVAEMAGRPTEAPKSSGNGRATDWNEIEGQVLLNGGRGLDGMSLRELLNVTQAWLRSQYGAEAVRKWLVEIEADTPEAQARIVAEKNRAGMQALSEVMSLPRAGR